MTTLALIQTLAKMAKEHRKRVWSLAELARLCGESHASVGMSLVRARKKGIVARVGSLWLNMMDAPTLEEVAFALVSPSYISFESALYRCGILSQAPRGAMTVATLGRPRLVATPLGDIRFIRLKRSLFFGYDAQRVAYPEKAWLDLLYLRRRKGDTIAETMYPESLNRKRMKGFAAHFPPLNHVNYGATRRNPNYSASYSAGGDCGKMRPSRKGNR